MPVAGEEALDAQPLAVAAGPPTVTAACPCEMNPARRRMKARMIWNSTVPAATSSTDPNADTRATWSSVSRGKVSVTRAYGSDGPAAAGSTASGSTACPCGSSPSCLAPVTGTS